jgi:hypothetical protein
VKEKRGDKKAAAVSATVGTIVCVAALILSVTGFIANVATLVVNCMKL